MRNKKHFYLLKKRQSFFASKKMKNTHREDKKIINFVFKKSQIFSRHTYLNYQQSNSNCLQLFTLTDVRHTRRLVDDRATINHAINLVFDVMIFNITREP